MSTHYVVIHSNSKLAYYLHEFWARNLYEILELQNCISFIRPSHSLIPMHSHLCPKTNSRQHPLINQLGILWACLPIRYAPYIGRQNWWSICWNTMHTSAHSTWVQNWWIQLSGQSPPHAAIKAHSEFWHSINCRTKARPKWWHQWLWVL